MIFVFGSNLSAIHGAGAALYAAKYEGASSNTAVGMSGNSYAIPTKGYHITFMPLEHVIPFINQFIKFSEDNPNLRFKVTRVGCGLAGFRDEEIAPLFSLAPKNCYFDTKWREYLGNEREYWGTF